MKLAITAICVGLLSSPAALATTYLVRPDGSGDFPTIQAAVVAATGGDAILLADGVFTGPGNRDVDLLAKPLAIVSESGDPAACTLDCEGSATDPHGAFRQTGGYAGETTLQGIRIIHAFCDGAAVTLHEQAGARVARCTFEGNQGNLSGGIWCSGSTLVVEECEFIGNSGEAGGGVGVHECTATIRDCVFRGNAATVCGGAIDAHYYADATIERCLFVQNRSDDVGGGVRFGYRTSGRLIECTFAENEALRGGGVGFYTYATPTVTGCTFYGNEGLQGSDAYCGDRSAAILSNCILAQGRTGAAVFCEGTGIPALGCCDIYGNAGGDWVECIADQLGGNGNLWTDPLFCDPAGGDFTLQEGSPCGPDYNPDCGLIGAWPVGCGGTPVEQTTWGAIKVMFRR